METGVNCRLLAAAEKVSHDIMVTPSILSSQSTQPITSQSQNSDPSYRPSNSEEMEFEEER
jgi:hypothetical protein